MTAVKCTLHKNQSSQISVSHQSDLLGL